MIGWSLLAAPPTAADSLHPGDIAGTLNFGEACTAAPWQRTYFLWYQIYEGDDSTFNLPVSPDLHPGTNLSVQVAPEVVGSLPGVVSLSGTTSLSGHISESSLVDPARTSWQGFFAGSFTLSYAPGGTTVGALPMPQVWLDRLWRYTSVGLAAIRADWQASDGSAGSVTMVAQPIRDCSATLKPYGSTAGPTLPPTDSGPAGTVGGSSALPIAAALIVASGAALLASRRMRARA